jgi:hypothetical protein
MDEFETTAVVEGDESAAVGEAIRKPKARGALKWETEARDRLGTAIRRYSKPLADHGRAVPATVWVPLPGHSQRASGQPAIQRQPLVV